MLDLPYGQQLAQKTARVKELLEDFWSGGYSRYADGRAVLFP